MIGLEDVNSGILVLIVLFFLFFQARFFGFKDLANPAVMALNYIVFFMVLGVLIDLTGIYDRYLISFNTKFFVVLSYGITAVAALLTLRVLNVDLKNTSFLNFKCHSLRASRSDDFFAYALFFFAVLLGVVFVAKNGFFVYSSIYSGESFENSRVEAVKGLGYLVIPMQILFVCSTGWIINSRRTGLVVKFIVFLAAVFFIFASGFRSAIAFIFLTVVMYRMYINDAQLKSGKIYLYSFVVFVLVVFFGVLRQGNEALFERFAFQVFWRSFVTLSNLEVIIDSNISPLYGGSFIKELEVLIPGPGQNLGSYLKDVLGFEFDGGGITPSLIGIGFVDFGYLGVLLYPVVHGICIALVYYVWPRIFGRNDFSFYQMLVFSILTSGVAAAGIVTPYLYFGLPIFLVALFYRVIYLNLKQKKLALLEH